MAHVKNGLSQSLCMAVDITPMHHPVMEAVCTAQLFCTGCDSQAGFKACIFSLGQTQALSNVGLANHFCKHRSVDKSLTCLGDTAGFARSLEVCAEVSESGQASLAPVPGQALCCHLCLPTSTTAFWKRRCFCCANVQWSDSRGNRKLRHTVAGKSRPLAGGVPDTSCSDICLGTVTDHLCP